MAAAILGALVSALLLGAAPAAAKVQVGDTAAADIASPPLAGTAGSPALWTHTVRHPDATFLKLHLARLALGPGDRLRIRDGDGRLVAEYADRHAAPPGFWVPSARGDTVTVELYAAGPGAAVAIDRYGYGTLGITIRSVCGTDEAVDVACHAGTPIAAASRPVGRMLFEQRGAFFACTGFLVSAFDLFMSAAHCVSTQGQVDSLEVTFDFQASACGGKDLEATRTFPGDRLVTTSVPLDMALMTLGGQPAEIYGFLPLSARAPVQDEPVYLPQHPDGGPKKVSVLGCQVSTPLTDGDAPDSDFGHRCDTEPGSSGSPVLDAADQVIGLHHIGGCTAGGGENLAVLMSRIRPLLPAPGATFALRGARLVPAGGFVTLRGALALGLESNGVDPLGEPVTLTLADADGPFYSVTLPAGALRRSGLGFLFTAGPAAAPSGLRWLRLIPRPVGAFEVVATARGAALGGADREQVTITVAIGDDAASQTVALRRLPRAFVSP